MSGIYISGMNMPENYRHMILMANGDVTDIDGTKIANAIELPPHGDLIDRSKIAYSRDDSVFRSMEYAHRAQLENITPVIPAEEE